MHNCDHEDRIRNIEDNVTEIKGDVKSLLRFKWQVMGGAGVIGAISAFILSILGILK